MLADFCQTLSKIASHEKLMPTQISLQDRKDQIQITLICLKVLVAVVYAICKIFNLRDLCAYSRHDSCKE